MAIIPKDQVEKFCDAVKKNFRYGEHYDAADLVADLTDFLRKSGVNVIDTTEKSSPFDTHKHNEEE